MIGLAAANAAGAASRRALTLHTAHRQLAALRPTAAVALPTSSFGIASMGARRALFLTPSPIVRAANPQAGKPASDNLEHMVRNAKEEAKGVQSTLESAVSGGQSGELMSDAKSIASEVTQQVPRPAIIFGALGIIPYVSTAGASVYLARQAQMVAQGLESSVDFETASALLLHAENVQITFGAVLLSFLGAIHWGFEFSKYGGVQGNMRYALGLVPVACAWPTLAMAPQMALVAQWAGFVLTWLIDLRATSAGWAPKWYSSYRFALTLFVGTSIIATLAGTNYYDVDKSTSSAVGVGRRLSNRNAESTERNKANEERMAQGKRGTVPEEQKVGGDVQAENSGEEGDGFVKIRNPKREEEERKKKEEEEKKKKEEEAKKKKEEKEGEGEAKKDEKDE